MTFPITPDVKVKKDQHGRVRQLLHPRQTYSAQSLPATLRATAPDRRSIADQYLREVLPHYNLDADMVLDLTSAIGRSLRAEGPKVCFGKEKVVRERATVSYVQTFLGLPVWQAGITVRMRAEPAEVTGSQSSVHHEIHAERPPDDAPFMPDKIDDGTLAQLLGLGQAGAGPKITAKELLIYRFDAQNRGASQPDHDDDANMHVALPTIDTLPDLPDYLTDGQHYVVVDVQFTLSHGGWDEVNWSAFVEPVTGAVLFLRAFVACLDALVYEQDPLTATGNSTIQPGSSAATLDSVRDRVTLPGLTPPSDPNEQQALMGEFVRMLNITPPNLPPPTAPQNGNFFFTVPSNDFSAVNAYYHCDRLFRLMRDMGFDVGTFFDGTTFPVRVDHRATIGGQSNTVNASAPGAPGGRGSDGFRFALLQVNTQVGIAVDWRVVLHEFGHAILWDNVSSPNFRFAHSAGDSLAAILNDVDSQAPDRGRTFPWTGIGRRHIRSPQSGFAWGGSHDDPFPVGHPLSADRAGYDREQILSSTLFRLYRAIGGDHSDVEVRRFASRHVVFLVFEVTGSITPFAQPQDAEDFADLMMDADLNTADFEGHPGGTFHKVIRWAFEQQGLYQPPGAPTPVASAGAPPAVDVFIDDGRGGEYTPDTSFVKDTTDVWTRRQADDGVVHQDPVAGIPNAIYVRVSNRGSATATNVQVRLFETQNPLDPAWPADWTLVGTTTGSDVAAGGNLIVGPIEWTPATEGDKTLLASVSADDDVSNADVVATAVQSAKLVHCDNNLAMRKVTVTAADGGDSGVTESVSPNLTIPDDNPAGISSELMITAAGTVARIAVTVDITHTFIGDLTVELVSPTGTQARLHNRSGFNTHDLIRTYSSDTIPALAAIKGEAAAGQWRLEVADHEGQDLGVLRTWGLTIELEAATAPIRRDSSPGLAIPDASSNGITDEILVGPSGTLASIAVDVKINHTFIGDLRVTLESPVGTRVRLHDHTGGATDDLDITFTRDNVPGLAAVQGEQINGSWKLHVADLLGIFTGTLVRWGLELVRT